MHLIDGEHWLFFDLHTRQPEPSPGARYSWLLVDRWRELYIPPSRPQWRAPDWYMRMSIGISHLKRHCRPFGPQLGFFSLRLLSLYQLGSLDSITMATRRQYPTDWSPVPHKIETRLSQLEPRDECVRLPKSNERALRPKPLNLPSKQPEDDSTGKILIQPRNQEKSESQEQIQDPQIVDVASASTSAWPRRGSKKGSYSRSSSSRKAPPSIHVPSTRQSEISLGILDYYLREPSPIIHSPEIPPRTLELDPAMDRFDFGLSAATTPTPPSSSSTTNVAINSDEIVSSSSSSSSKRPRALTNNTQSGRPLIPISPPSQSRPSATLTNRGGYTLFPVIQEITPPPRQPNITLVEASDLPLPHQTPTSTTVVCSSDSNHSNNVASPPETTYRPRKESISSSIRTRNHSINSFQARLLGKHQRQQSIIPLRILSLNSRASTSPTSHQRQPSTPRTTTSTTQYSPSSFLFLSSPPSSANDNKCRWSDESTNTNNTFATTSHNNNNTIPTNNQIIQSPSHAPTPDPRTSFGSLLRRDSAQYPACFFDDDDDDDDNDDESVPLSRKWAWNKKKNMGKKDSTMMMTGRESKSSSAAFVSTSASSSSSHSARRDGKGVREIWDEGGSTRREGGGGGGGFWRGFFCGCAGR